MFLHELQDAAELFEAVALDKKINPSLVEKDYWIMHALWGLKKQGFDFHLKGGTSLSKGFHIIERFSEDIDIVIVSAPGFSAPSRIKKNHNSKNDVKLRKEFYDKVCEEIDIPGMTATRDNEFDNRAMRSAGIRLLYQSLFELPEKIKSGVLIEAGFDLAEPSESIDIKSWAYSAAENSGVSIEKNTADGIKCYYPEYTFVEKLQAIITKVRNQQKDIEGKFPQNFLRHFYDLHMLFEIPRVKNFIGTHEYKAHKSARFSNEDNIDLKQNLAFQLDRDPALFQRYELEYSKLESLFYNRKQIVPFSIVYESIKRIARMDEA